MDCFRLIPTKESYRHPQRRYVTKESATREIGRLQLVRVTLESCAIMRWSHESSMDTENIRF